MIPIADQNNSKIHRIKRIIDCEALKAKVRTRSQTNSLIDSLNELVQESRRDIYCSNRMTRGLLNFIRRRDKLFKNSRNCPQNEYNRQEYTEYRALTNKLINISEKLYYENDIEKIGRLLIAW
ncbi:hypothetical protein HHI36_003981 [Cryptolaemus montrouzieri]|uniref:Uncharacterized protein n=1 Tax=Cryptolaemus montrouzieri TaxID=559131 RepID=A0ABD2NPT3_9CUCU